MKPDVRHPAGRLAWVLVGVVIGAVVMLAAVRSSRNPDGFLYAVRVLIGIAPLSSFEAKWLERTYGPARHSYGPEEWIVRDFFVDKRNGRFVDVGAADYRTGSNTWFLESELGWSGVAIDAQDHYRAGYERYRPRTRFFTFFVSDRSDDRMRLFLSELPVNASWQPWFAERAGPQKGVIEVATITLNDLLEAQQISAFDFLSMDIELAEPKALAGLDLRRFKPQLVCIEAHPEVRQEILDYFTRHGYAVVGKYLQVDTLNLWFMPVGSKIAPFPSMEESANWLLSRLPWYRR